MLENQSLSQLFLRAFPGPWQQVGHEVSYRFERDGSTLYIFFDSSNEIMDWIRNFMFAKRPYKDMKTPYRVHRGFLASWKEVEDIVKDKINDVTIKKIITVGYSHGAALAAFCHECCWFNRPDIRQSIVGIAFEAPRIYAGFKVKKSLRERWDRFYVVRNDKDIVTHCPPAIFGYCHVGNILHIGRGFGSGPIKSHYPQNVLDALRRSDF